MRERVTGIDWAKRYSDSSEDLILRMLFPYRTGTYLEAGVWEPVRMSNTYVFYEMGWSGLLIEPVPFWARRAHAARPRDTIVNRALSDAACRLKLTLCGPSSTLAQDWLTDRKGEPEIVVEAVRLADLLGEHPAVRDHCDFFTLDVEGYERRVLDGVDFATFRPTVLCIEAVRWNPFYRTHQQWEGLLLSHGYKLICHNLQNRFYGLTDRPELWEEVSRWNLAE